MQVAKRILLYLTGTYDHGVHYTLANQSALMGYFDSD